MKYRIELGDQVIEYRANRVHDFHRELFYSSDDEGYRYFIDGKQVTNSEARAACESAFEAAWNKKAETHKRVRVSTGVTRCDNTFREVWVKK
jgi:hypothetical protein